MESFLEDAGFSEKQLQRFNTYVYARRNRLFYFQLATTSIIKSYDSRTPKHFR